MLKDKLREIKIIYYPYQALKSLASNTEYFFRYRSSLANIKRVTERVREKVNRKEVLNVVFVTQYIPSWNKLEPIYRKMKGDARFNPVILCVPSNIENGQLVGDRVNDTYEYFVSKGYEAIDALLDNGKWFDLTSLEPDYLFHPRPYNEFMPEEYTSREVCKYALICNVLYGNNMTMHGEDFTLHKSYYSDVYAFFALEKGEARFYKDRFALGFKKGIQKCPPYGSICLEQILDEKKEKDPSEFRKTLIWCPRWTTDPYIGGSNYFNYKDTLIDLAKDNQDVLFIFRPHPLMFDNFVNTGEMTPEDVKEFKDYCNKEKNIVLDETKEYVDTFWNTDFMISDSSGMIPEYYITGKPVVFCHASNINFTFTEFAKTMVKSCYEARTKEDIKTIFYDLINDNDYKADERKQVIADFFVDAQNSSTLITNFLAEDI